MTRSLPVTPHFVLAQLFKPVLHGLFNFNTVFLSLRVQRTLYTLGTYYTSPFLEIIIANFHQVLNWVLFRDYHDFILATAAMLQVRKWRLKEVGELAPGHTRISGGPAQAAHPGQTGSKSMLVTTMRRHCLIYCITSLTVGRKQKLDISNWGEGIFVFYVSLFSQPQKETLMLSST